MLKSKIISLVGGISLFAGLFAPAVAQAYSVQMDINTQVANVTRGDTTYSESVPALVDQVVKVEVWFHNHETVESGHVAHNLVAKVVMPTAQSTSHNIVGQISSTESGTVSDGTTVTTQIPTNLAYIPGSAVYRTNVGTDANPVWQDRSVSDSIVTSGGVNLGDLNPCWNFQSTVTILARVTAPALSITKQVRHVGETAWVTENTAKPGDELEYLVTIRNMGNLTLNNVVIGDNLPPHATYEAGTTQLKNGANPNGIKITSNNVVSGGINIGNYNPGAIGYVWFRVKLNNDFAVGTTKLINVGVTKSDEVGPFYNTAITTVTVGTPTTPTTPTTPVTPTTAQPLAQTGAAETAAGAVALLVGGLGYWYFRTRRELAASLLDR
jgi:uncharacterized repeat protein (TIGR01451 family)